MVPKSLIVIHVLILEAFMSLPAYTFSGIYKELQKHFGSSVRNYIVAARVTQGYEQLAASTEEQRLDVIKRWQATQLELHKEKELVKHGGLHQQSNCVFLRVKNATRPGVEGKKHTKGNPHKVVGFAEQTSSARNDTASTTLSSQESQSGGSLMQTDSATFEEAIQQSVEATSHGNPQEDAMIERAIRASIVELRAASTSGDENQAIQRAIKASVAEAARARKANVVTNSEPADSDQDEDLRAALHRSISSQATWEHGMDPRYDDSGVDTDDDENIKMALERSKSDYLQTQGERRLLQKDTEQSEMRHSDSRGKREMARTEEEIVLEYVKKQSLLEGEHRRSLASRTDPAPGANRDGA